MRLDDARELDSVRLLSKSPYRLLKREELVVDRVMIPLGEALSGHFDRMLGRAFPQANGDQATLFARLELQVLKVDEGSELARVLVKARVVLVTEEGVPISTLVFEGSATSGVEPGFDDIGFTRGVPDEQGIPEGRWAGEAVRSRLRSASEKIISELMAASSQWFEDNRELLEAYAVSPHLVALGEAARIEGQLRCSDYQVPTREFLWKAGFDSEEHFQFVLGLYSELPRFRLESLVLRCAEEGESYETVRQEIESGIAGALDEGELDEARRLLQPLLETSAESKWLLVLKDRHARLAEERQVRLQLRAQTRWDGVLAANSLYEKATERIARIEEVREQVERETLVTRYLEDTRTFIRQSRFPEALAALARVEELSPDENSLDSLRLKAIKGRDRGLVQFEAERRREEARRQRQAVLETRQAKKRREGLKAQLPALIAGCKRLRKQIVALEEKKRNAVLKGRPQSARRIKETQVRLAHQFDAISERIQTVMAYYQEDGMSEVVSSIRRSAYDCL